MIAMRGLSASSRSSGAPESLPESLHDEPDQVARGVALRIARDGDPSLRLRGPRSAPARTPRCSPCPWRARRAGVSRTSASAVSSSKMTTPSTDGQRADDLRALAGRHDGPPRSLEPAHRGVPVDADEEGIAERAGVAGGSARGRRGGDRSSRWRGRAACPGAASPRPAGPPRQRRAAAPSSPSDSESSCGGDRRRASLHHHHAAGHVGEPRGLDRARACGEGDREGADHGVARAGDVGDLIAPVDRHERHRPLALEQRHAAAARA